MLLLVLAAACTNPPAVPAVVAMADAGVEAPASDAELTLPGLSLPLEARPLLPLTRSFAAFVDEYKQRCKKEMPIVDGIRETSVGCPNEDFISCSRHEFTEHTFQRLTRDEHGKVWALFVEAGGKPHIAWQLQEEEGEWRINDTRCLNRQSTTPDAGWEVCTLFRGASSLSPTAILNEKKPFQHTSAYAVLKDLARQPKAKQIDRLRLLLRVNVVERCAWLDALLAEAHQPPDPPRLPLP